MTKIADQLFFDQTENKIIRKRTYDQTDTLRQVEEIKRQGLGQTGESRLVGRIPMNLVAEWVKEAGLDWSDGEAVRDVVRRKILSGDFDKFRVWEGTY
jgi:hypothetical protein